MTGAARQPTSTLKKQNLHRQSLPAPSSLPAVLVHAADHGVEQRINGNPNYSSAFPAREKELLTQTIAAVQTKARERWIMCLIRARVQSTSRGRGTAEGRPEAQAQVQASTGLQMRKQTWPATRRCQRKSALGRRSADEPFPAHPRLRRLLNPILFLGLRHAEA